MAESEANAVAAGRYISVGGREYHLTPVAFQTLQEVQQEALRTYKRRYLQTYRDNLDLLPPEEADGAMARKIEEVAKWTVRDLPKKLAYSCASCPVTPEARDWVAKHYGARSEADDVIRYLLTTALDAGQITPDEVERLCGVGPGFGHVQYDLWWVTADREGMAAFVHAALWKEHKLTREEIGSWPMVSVVEAARSLEMLTAPDVGN
jgi:hypothetical protein